MTTRQLLKFTLMELTCIKKRIKKRGLTTGIVHALRDTHHTQTVTKHILKRYKIHIILGSIVLLLFGVYKVFTNEFISMEQEYLIKKNYRNKQDIFLATQSDFKLLPHISIDFNEGDKIDFRSTGFKLSDLDSGEYQSLFDNGEIAHISIHDSTKHIFYNNLISDLKEIEISDSTLKVILENDSIITINKFWQISYSGTPQTDFYDEVLKTLNLNFESLEYLKTLLRERNCFGCTIDEDVIILHYSSQKNFVITAYSYCIFKDENCIDSYLNSWYEYEKIDSNIYWFFYDEIQVIDLLNSRFYTRDI